MQQQVANHFLTITQPSINEFKERGSKFIAQAFPVLNADECKAIIKQIKLLHPKANHHCFAYRLGYNNDNFRSSDAGEPNGSAGKPILNQIDSKQLTNILVVVTRYFGGTLLGMSGLINAYKTATILTLQTIPIVQKQIMLPYTIECDYRFVNEVLQLVKTHNCEVLQQAILLFVTLEINIPKANSEIVLKKLNEINGVKVK